MSRQPPPPDWQAALRPMPNTKTVRELTRALLPQEAVLAWAQGKAGVLLVATERRVIVAKVGVAATAQWFGRKVISFAYGQIASVDLHTGLADGYAQVLSAGQAGAHRMSRYTQLVHADNVVPFARAQEADFRRVVAVITERLYPVGGGR